MSLVEGESWARWVHDVRRIEFDAVIRYVPLGRDATALELGSGDGFQLEHLRQRFARVFAIDPARRPPSAWGFTFASAEATDCDGTVVYPSPSSWSSSNTAIATISGSGMMTGVAPGQVTITANFTSAPAQTGTFCAPHICVTQTASGSSPETVSPGILRGGCSGSEIAGTTQNAVVGQQIVLCGSYNLPSGVSATGQSWSVGGTTKGGFTYASDYSSGGYTAATFNQTSTTFYWLAPGNSLQVKFTLNLSNGSSPSAKATFNVAGPTGVSVSTPTGKWLAESTGSGYLLDLGLPLDPEQGIKFNGKATSPPSNAGTYEWAQFVTTNTETFTQGSTKITCSTGTGLDTQFPYDTGLSTSDSPSTSLPSGYSQKTWSLGFTMYLMWRPGLSSDIPVPLGYVSWQAYGDAAQSGGNWTVQSDSSVSANSFQASSSPFQSWTSKVHGGAQTCQ